MPIDNSIQNRTFEELFSGSVSFEIPFFQRAYSWERQQWKQLLDDIVEQILIDVVDGIRVQIGDEKLTKELLEKHLLAHEHYFGAVVVLEKTNSHPNLKSFTVIDGQQRITTVYILLGVITNLLKSKGNLSEKMQQYIHTLEGYLKNAVDPKGDDYRKLKVYSNKGDRLPTYLKMFGVNPQSPSLSIDQQLYIVGQNQIEEFWDYANKKLKGEDGMMLWAYSQAILKSLKIVWIPLDEKKDNPQAIFEGLNDKGMPLSAVELLCSYIFKPLIDEVTKQHESIHNEKWLKSIKDVGGESDFEFYLRNLFSIGLPKMIGKGRKLYAHFKNSNKAIGKQAAFDSLNEISNNVELFNQITQPTNPNYRHPNATINNLLIHIDRTRMSSSIPLTLDLLRALKSGKISEADTVTILKSLMVLLVRRKICELPTTRYDEFFPSLLSKLIDEPDKARAFRGQVVQESLFVSDQEFEAAFVNKTLYKQTELEFARLVLQEIDRAMQVFGQLPDYSSINTIEHVLPQTLDEEWKRYLGNDVFDPSLERMKHCIGNLCLISKPANSSAGQDPFDKKKSGYTDVSSLTKDLKNRNVKWTIDAIKARSADLAKHGLAIWSWN